MLLELLKLLTASLLVSVMMLVVTNIIASRRALIRFVMLSRGLPILPGADLIGNHAYNVLLGDRLPKRLQEAHKELGKTIGWLRGTDFCVSTTDLDLVKTFILDEPNRHLDRIDMRIPFHEIDFNIVNAREKQWRPMRQAIAPALAPSKFKTRNVQEEIEGSIRKLVGLIESRLNATNTGSEYFVADDVFGRYSGDLVYKSFYKQDNLIDYEAERDEGVHEIEQAMATVKDSWFVYIGSIFPQFLGLIEWLAIKFTLLGKLQSRFRKFAEDQVSNRLAARRQWPELKREAAARGASIDPHDFELRDGTRYKRNMADHIIDQYIDGKFAKEDFYNNNLFFMLAGYRTAADCLIHTSYLLAINQDAQDKLRASILADGTDSDYLDWVLRESLRLLPPAPIGCSRTVTRDIELPSGHLIPSGTYVLAHASVIHRLKEYWGEDADEFRPDRWRDTSHHHPMQYVAFGAGARGCPGRQFAMHEMKMLLVALLTRYRFAGGARDDAYEFDCPYNMYVVPNSDTRIEISRL